VQSVDIDNRVALQLVGRVIRELARDNRPLWIAFALALAFLGHDLLMAATAHTLGMHHAAAMQHAMPAATAASSDIAHEAHADGCSTTRPVAQPSNDDPGLGLAVSAVLPANLAEPPAPPGVRRALLQVYRI